MLNIANIEFARKRFEKAFNYYGEQGIPPQLSFLRIEEDLVDGRGNYDFNLRKENLATYERNLRRNDLFIVLGMSVFLRIEDEDKGGTLPMHFYAKKGRVTVTPATVSDPAVYTLDEYGFLTSDIEALYNGKLFIQTGTTVNFEGLPTSLFKKESAGIEGTQANYVKDVNNAVDVESALKTMSEELVLAGTQDHKIQVSFPAYNGSDFSAAQAGNGTSVSDDTIVPTTHFKSKIGFYALGYLIPGGTNDTYKNDPANPFRKAI